MRLLLTAVAIWASCLSFPARSEQGFVVVMPGRDVRANGRGLECRQTAGLLPAYTAPSAASPRAFSVQGMVAVTGPARDGYIPIVVQDGRRGWLREAHTWANSRALHKACFIRRDKDGRLRGTSFNAIQSD